MEFVVTGNHFDKYASRHPVHRFLMRRFIDTACTLLRPLVYEQILEVGCGAGELAVRLFAQEPGAVNHPPRVERKLQYLGIDIGAAEIQQAQLRCPSFRFAVASAYQLPVGDSSQDLVIACEVLEHLEDVDAALSEIRRVAAGHVLISVPCEPLWRGLNMLRGKYWGELGNTPGHVQHFSAAGLYQLVSKYFEIVRVMQPLPWTMMLARARGQEAGDVC